MAEQCADDLSREDVLNLFDDRDFAALFINNAFYRTFGTDKRGEVPLRSRIIGLCCCCCRGRNRDTPLARWASTPSFLTGSLSTNATPSMENEREPDSPTTEQPRATNFDSVPSIPSDLF